MQYGQNIMGDQGTHIFLLDLVNKQTKKGSENLYEFISTKDDIKLNP